MKKKLFLMLTMVAMLVCVLAISVGASTVYKDSDGNTLFSYEVNSSNIITSYTGSFPRTDAQGNALTWYVTATKNENGNTVKTVASVLTTDSSYFSITDGVYSYGGTSGKPITQYNVVSVNFPHDAGITSLSLENAGYRSNSGAYNYNSSEMLCLYLPKTLTSLPERLGQATKILICDIPNEVQVEYISHVMFHDARCLREINIPSSVKEIKGVSIGEGTAFYNTVSLEKVTFGSNDNLEKIGVRAFHKSGLKYITLPDSLQVIEEHAFSESKLVSSPFTENSRITTIGGRAFGDISTLQEFIVPVTLTNVAIYGDKGVNDYGPLANSTVQLVTFGKADNPEPLVSAFFGRAKITKIVFPSWVTHIPSWYFVTATIDDITFGENITTVGERIFQFATVKKIRLGAGFKYFTNSANDHQSFTHNANSVKEIYIPASFYAQAPETNYWVSYAFSCGSSSNIKFFYAGTLDQLTKSMTNFKAQTNSGTENWKFTGASQISWAAYSANPSEYENGNYIIYDYSACDAFYEGAHGEIVDIVNCIGSCQRCNESVASHIETENMSVSIEYSNYEASGIKTITCQNEGCTYTASEDTPALFICLGFSTPTNGRDGIVISFTVDKEAVAEYVGATGKTFKYGAFAAAKDNIGTNDVIDASGATPAKVVCADLTEYNLISFDLVIVGFEDDQKDLGLAMGAYVIDGDTVSYMQAGTPESGAKYYFASYNTVMDLIAANKAA